MSGPEAAQEQDEGAMSILGHLDELRTRLFRSALAVIVMLGAMWSFRDPLLTFVMKPIQSRLPEGQSLQQIEMMEAFSIYLNTCALAAVFVATPFLLYQLWAFIAPGLYRHERRMIVPFLVFGTLFFVGGGAFGYLVAVPVAADWLISLGSDTGLFDSSITLRSAFKFVSRMILAMGLVFETPLLIFFLSRLGLVTPGFLLRHFRVAVLVIAIFSAVITPTGDMVTMSVFAVPMILLYLVGCGAAWLVSRRDRRDDKARAEV